MVQAVPDGYPTVTPYLAVRGATGLIEFIQNAFDAKQRGELMTGPGGEIGHGEFHIGDSLVMVGDLPEGHGEPPTAMLHVYVEDCDAMYERALAAGAESVREPETMFYGDRSGAVRDKWGNQWHLATHVEDVSQEEMMRRVQEFYQEQP